MLKLSLSVFFLNLTIALSQSPEGYSESDIEFENKRISSTKQFLDSLDENNLSDEQLETLALKVSSLRPSRSAIRWRQEELDELYVQAKERILRHEGHADHFVSKIRKTHAQLESYDPKMNWSLANREISKSTRFLSAIPSHESVVGLASLLNMQENWWGQQMHNGKKPKIYRGQSGNNASSIAGYAAAALYKLELDGGASAVWTLQKGNFAGEIVEYNLENQSATADELVGCWKIWWQEVIDGERTFGFKGDTKRYNHIGVVLNDGSVLPLKSVSNNFPTESKNTKAKPQSKPDLWIYWLLGILICGGAALQIRGKHKGSNEQ